MFCMQCGSELADGSQFCNVCGAKQIIIGEDTDVDNANPENVMPSYEQPMEQSYYEEEPEQVKKAGKEKDSGINKGIIITEIILTIVAAVAIVIYVLNPF